MTASALMQWTSGHLFVVVSGTLLGASAAGIIKASQNIVGITNIIIQGMENFVPGMIAKAYKNEGLNGMLSTIKEVIIKGMFFIGMLLLLLSIFSEYIMLKVYGAEYSSFGNIVYLLALVNFVGFLGTPIGAGLRVLENTKVIFSSFVLATIFSFLFAFVLISNFELIGAVLGLVFVKFILIGFMCLGFRKEINSRKNIQKTYNY